jgi:prepilin-type N-terminal cleavage/methylation domain-containing protein
MNLKCTKNKAFTLAEVLITLLIIGVVSSLVIPALINDTSDQELRTAWTKQFSVLSQAIYQIQVENGGYIDTSSGYNLFNEMQSKIIIQKSGTWSSISNLPSDFYYKCYKSSDSSNKCNNWQTMSIASNKPTAVTSNGSFIFILNALANCNGSNYRIRLKPSDPIPKSNLCNEIAIDVNGDKGPNMIGKDYYLGVLLKENNTYYFKPSSLICMSGYPDDFNQSLGCAQKALLGGDMP